VRRVGVLAGLGLTVGLILTSTSGTASARGSRMRLTSPAFQSGAMIPTGFTCDDQGVPPPLRWSGLPARSVELALTLEDLDGPGGRFVHWLAWGIDPASRSLPEGVVPAGVQEGWNSAGRIGYRAPCPPAGSDPHRYQFTLYALRRHLTLTAGATIDQLHAALRGLVLGQAQLVGRYAR
jgi:Raf kinase inhibitor-like YbhB/YbcL family protein